MAARAAAGVPRAADGGRSIGIGDVLEWSSEDNVADVKELIIRGEKFVGFEEGVGEKLGGLTMLSLSNNALRGVDTMRHCTGLEELNLNFNQIASLASLTCTGVRRLYLSNNRISSLTPLAGFASLETLCLFRNQIFDLDGALSVLKALPKLRSLDLDGNPCASRPSTKHAILQALPRLKVLDGEPIQPLDRELADMYFAQELDRKSKQGGMARPSTAPAQRATLLPSGALRGPVRLFRQDALNSNSTVLGYLAEDATNTSYKSVEDISSAVKENGGRLTVMDDGSDPVAALEALLDRGGQGSRPASGGSFGSDGSTDGGEGGPARRGLDRGRARLSDRNLSVDASIESAAALTRDSSPSSFVGRLRSLNGGGSGEIDDGSLPRSSSRGSMSNGRPGSSGSGGAGPRRLASIPRTLSGNELKVEPDIGKPPAMGRKPRSRSGSSGAGDARLPSDSPLPGPIESGSLSADPSDPHTTIRKLLRTIEIMQDERDRLRDALDDAVASGGVGGVGPSSSAASKSGDQAALQEEVMRLRTENANMFALSDENTRLKVEIAKLKREFDQDKVVNENRTLRMDLQELQEKYLVLKSQRDLWEVQRPKTAAEVIEEVADQDGELADLFRRNERTMREIRRDLSAAKRELGDTPEGGAPPVHPDTHVKGAPSHRLTSNVSAPTATPPRKPRRTGASPLQDRLTAGHAAGAAVPVSGAAFAFAPDMDTIERPRTANLLNRDIETDADLDAAYAALGEARAKRKELDKARARLESRSKEDVDREMKVYIDSIRAKAMADSEADDDDEVYSSDGGDDDDTAAARGKRTERTLHEGGADILVIDSD